MPYCGGTLITSKYILTAGHCLKDKGVYFLCHTRLDLKFKRCINTLHTGLSENNVS